MPPNAKPMATTTMADDEAAASKVIARCVRKHVSKKGSAAGGKVSNPIPMSLGSLFWSKKSYQVVSDEFHPFHKHDLNVLLHLVTTSLGVWGAVQLPASYGMVEAVYAYAALIFLTTPILTTGLLHTACVYGFLQVSATAVATAIASNEALLEVVPQFQDLQAWHVCLAAIALGFGLQDAAHWLCDEQTYMSAYLAAKGQAYKLVLHTLWLMPLVIDSVVIKRHCFLPLLFVTRNRNVITQVANRASVESLREWINQNVPAIAETTHVWPHKQEGTAKPTLTLESDSGIMAGFRSVYAPHHYDVLPIQGMNEIYVTAVGAKKEINSDAVFYTPHCDGPYWFLPFASCYRVLVGLTPNEMVRTRFNLQTNQDQVLDMYDVVGFDYNRELHWIDHVPGTSNQERRSLMKLHYIVYPKGWHRYGKLCALLNTNYNTWARGNFLRTLRVQGLYEYVLAWWIWLTTWTNAMFEEYFGWSNLVYLLATFLLLPARGFLIATSFRHYAMYMTTFAYGQPAALESSKLMGSKRPVAHGYLMRDAKLYKTIALSHLASRVLPQVTMVDDWPVVLMAVIGFSITISATAQLGMVRTYFGSELGLVKPKWISGFPYNCIPHPMIVGQLVAFGSILLLHVKNPNVLSGETTALLLAHMGCYTAHMIQEILTSSY